MCLSNTSGSLEEIRFLVTTLPTSVFIAFSYVLYRQICRGRQGIVKLRNKNIQSWCSPLPYSIPTSFSLPSYHESLVRAMNQMKLSYLCFPCIDAVSHKKSLFDVNPTWKQPELIWVKSKIFSINLRRIYRISVSKRRQSVIGACFCFPLLSCFYIWYITLIFLYPLTLLLPLFAPILLNKFRRLTLGLIAMNRFDKELSCLPYKINLNIF